MERIDAAKVIKRVRQRLEVSQEKLARMLNATKGAVQHWERGRNRPDLARLLALRQICPPCAERKELDGLLKATQAQVTAGPAGRQPGLNGGSTFSPPNENLIVLRKDNNRLRKQVGKLESILQRKNEQLRILEDVAADLQRELARLRATQPINVSDSAIHQNAG